jgi:hypothetical protein
LIPVFRRDLQRGIIEEARIMVIEALTERFIAVPPEIIATVNSVKNGEMLKELLRYAIRTSHIEDFKDILAKILPA